MVEYIFSAPSPLSGIAASADTKTTATSHTLTMSLREGPLLKKQVCDFPASGATTPHFRFASRPAVAIIAARATTVLGAARGAGVA